MIARELPHLRRYALALTGDRTRADDLVQDALERGLRKRHLLLRRGSVRSWLFTLLYRVHLNGRGGAARARRQVPLEELEHPALSTCSRQEDQLACLETVEALGTLPLDQRDALLLAAQEIPYDEAAGLLGIPVGTLRSRLSRGREALRHLSAQGVRPARRPRED